VTDRQTKWHGIYGLVW